MPIFQQPELTLTFQGTIQCVWNEYLVAQQVCNIHHGGNCSSRYGWASSATFWQVCWRYARIKYSLTVAAFSCESFHLNNILLTFSKIWAGGYVCPSFFTSPKAKITEHFHASITISGSLEIAVTGPRTPPRCSIREDFASRPFWFIQAHPWSILIDNAFVVGLYMIRERSG